MIRLEGRFEGDDYWREVRQTGDERLGEAGLDDWLVTLRSPTGAESEHTARDETEPIIGIDAAARTLDIKVDEQPDLPPESFVQTSIIDVIELATGARDDDGQDPVRDVGGEG